MAMWNLWHGCQKISPGCKNCYVYRSDTKYDRDPSYIYKTGDFDLPVKRKRDGSYKIPPGETLYTCFTSDFFLEDADCWRKDAWTMIKERSDINFFIITKRIHRFYQAIPDDWGDGYGNVTICCTCENSEMANFRLPVFLKAPIKHKGIICEPLLERVNLTPYLNGEIEEVVAGGESGEQARVCDYEWILDIRDQCMKANVPFYFKQTGAKFFKNGTLYQIKRKYQHSQAKKAGINTLKDYRSNNGHSKDTETGI